MPARTAGHQFVNPEKKPLGQLRLSVVDDGAALMVPALDMRWAPRKCFTNYVGLMASGGRIKTGVELEEWQYEAECFRDDIAFLLSRRHHEFWSYMVYQKPVLAALVSFLQRATPFYVDLATQAADVHVTALYEEILTLVLRVMCRLITNKESPEEWITHDHHRELVYTYFLISVPMLFDLLVAVGDADAQNAVVLRRIFAALLQIEPNYKDDLLAALAFFRAAFRSIQTQTENEGFEGAGGGAADDSAETPYDDVALYTLDCAYSLSVLLEVCPVMRSVCADIKFGQSIARFYDSTIPFLYKNIFQVNEAAISLTWLNQARLQYLRAFRSIAYSFVEKVLTKPEDCLLPSENFVELLTECLSEQMFVVDYEREYPVEWDMDILKQACKEMDDFKASFVAKGYKKEAEAESFGTIGNIARTTKQAQQQSPRNADTVYRHNSSSPVVNGDFGVSVASTAAAANAATRDFDVEVTAVLDVLPHLGTRFVRYVLQRYDNSEEAIAAILEENLPPDLVNEDRTAAYIPPDPQDKLFEQTGVKHFNVYDGDAYDIMTQDNPNCIIKQGKGMPNAARNIAELLDDKSELAKVRHRYQEYTLVTENDEDLDEYEDEYDDSYEALLESETRVQKIRSKEIMAGLANVQDVSAGESEEDSDDNEDVDAKTNAARGGGKSMNFCENPEDVRARYEAARQAKWANRGGGGRGGGGGGGAAAAQQTPARDVVGAPKGKGQDKDTLRNRNKKEVNKSSRANHNRKAGATHKRNKGMMS